MKFQTEFGSGVDTNETCLLLLFSHLIINRPLNLFNMFVFNYFIFFTSKGFL